MSESFRKKLLTLMILWQLIFNLNSVLCITKNYHWLVTTSPNLLEIMLMKLVEMFRNMHLQLQSQKKLALCTEFWLQWYSRCWNSKHNISLSKVLSLSETKLFCQNPFLPLNKHSAKCFFSYIFSQNSILSGNNQH